MQNYSTQSPFGFLIDELVGSHDAFDLSTEDHWFYQALLQAYQSVGTTYPNPSVGSVIVKDNQIIGRGFTAPAGGSHAEINALNEAGSAALGATLYSTLEPCNHFGRTPPCTQAIAAAGIKKVVIGIKDPNPRVDGNGIRSLRAAGIEVVLRQQDVLNDRAHALILPFSKYLQQQLPWVICKVATSLDGCVTKKQGMRTPISHSKMQTLTHRLRHRMDAVMVGSQTVMIDNPALTVRHANCNFIRSPHRVVVDGRLQTSIDSLVYEQDSVSTHVFHTNLASEIRKQEFDKASIRRIEVPRHGDHVSLSHVLKEIAKMGMTSVLVECGSHMLTQFIQQQLADELWWVVSPKLFGRDGQNAFADSIPYEVLRHINWSKPVVMEEDALFLGLHRG